MDIRKIKKLVELLLHDSDVYEIEIKEGEEAVRITRAGAAPVIAAPAPVAAPAAIAAPAAPQAAPSFRSTNRASRRGCQWPPSPEPHGRNLLCSSESRCAEVC